MAALRHRRPSQSAAERTPRLTHPAMHSWIAAATRGLEIREEEASAYLHSRPLPPPPLLPNCTCACELIPLIIPCLQLRPLGAGFTGFLCALGGYFLLLPLRDEAGVALGTDKLPVGGEEDA